MKIKIYVTLATLMAMLWLCGCQKDFLDKKPSTDIVQPTSLEEFQSLLDNYNIINVSAGLGVISADDHEFYSDVVWRSARSATERNAYIWAKDLYEGEVSEDWNKPYSTIFYANNILAGLEALKFNSANQVSWNQIKGSALFMRAFAFYDLVNNFAPIYDMGTAVTDLGVPLRLSPSIDILLPRATVKENYDRIIADLTLAGQLLSAQLPAANRNRPSKIAVHALFSRIYLQMRAYDKAELHADSCLQLYSKLIDYATLNKTATAPFSTTNDELIYSKQAVARVSYGAAANTFVKISPEVIALYEANDLRLSLYFARQTDGSYRIKRGYNGNNNLYPFVGLATDEVYLIKAECLATRGESTSAMTVLNQLLIKRWDSSATIPAKPYPPLGAATPQDALDKVLLERRKELVFRGLRWDDLKRLNKEGANLNLSRTVDGTSYTLLPNSPKYVFPIPDNEIALSGITQNNR